MRYQWDDEKNRTNRAKHGISFEQATKAFQDPYVVSRYEGFDGGEHRYRVLGLVDGVMVLFVAFANRRIGLGDDVVRIISARRATAPERKIYEEETRPYR